jgi:hypothetical protein
VTTSTVKNVYEAWGAVMLSVKAIGKNDENKQQGFAFRGIDATMQAVGPALREHGVMVVPTGQELRTEAYSTRSGTQMKNVTVTVEYTVYGPAGDKFCGVSYGEAADVGDKAVTKAQSVALRTFLLQALMVPTGDPDPDASSHERAAAAPPPTPMQEALEELGDLCAGLGLSPTDVSAKFFAIHKVVPRGSTPETVREFMKGLSNKPAEAEQGTLA